MRCSFTYPISILLQYSKPTRVSLFLATVSSVCQYWSISLWKRLWLTHFHSTVRSPNFLPILAKLYRIVWRSLTFLLSSEQNLHLKIDLSCANKGMFDHFTKLSSFESIDFFMWICFHNICPPLFPMLIYRTETRFWSHIVHCRSLYKMTFWINFCFFICHWDLSWLFLV